MRIESSVKLNSSQAVKLAGFPCQRPDAAQVQAPGEVRTLGELLACMHAFHGATLDNAAVSTGKFSLQHMRSPMPYRISLTFEEVGGAVRLHEVVEVAALPAPGGPQAVRAIQQQIERNLLNWQRRLSPAARAPRPATADRSPR